MKTLDYIKKNLPESIKAPLRPSYKRFISFLSSIEKRKEDLESLTHKKLEGYSKYSIVCACYNVDKYIDAFIKSVVNQSLDFANNIQLILVDDGSTDSTGYKINEWCKRYPDNIIYCHQENSGQASARNTGLKYVKHKWVSFCDPDDFLGLKTFETIDSFLERKKDADICMISMNILLYYEEQNLIRDNHALKYKYENKETIKQISQLNDFIQLSASSALFLTEVITDNTLLFDTKCRPNFEDAKFLNIYLYFCDDASVAFLKNATYYYRKRSLKNSSTDLSWSVKEKYNDLLVYGYIDLLKFYAEKGHVPTFVQNTVLYDCFWHLSYLINRPDRISFLSSVEKQNYLNLLEKVYSYCDREIILSYKQRGFSWFYYKIGVLKTFKHIDSYYPLLYIEAYDPKDNSIRLRYYTRDIGTEEFFIGGVKIKPTIEKSVDNFISEKLFVRERVFWLPVGCLPDDCHLLFRVNNVYGKINFRGMRDSVPIYEIKNYFNVRQFDEKSQYAHCWLISDRDTNADDNGEHFYRYLKVNHPEVNAFFLLNRSSHDWDRLEKEGFRLIEFGSRIHREAWKNCDHIISSQADGYAVNYFGDNYNDPKNWREFTFLQHGVIKDDLSLWLNTKRINHFITSTRPEYDSIAGDHNQYKNLTQKEVVLTGLPRHDSLLVGNCPQKVILVMPTWRQSLVGKILNHSAAHEKNPDFMSSQYAKSWSSFLKSDELRKVIDENGYQVIFFPHVNIQPYLSDFNLPDYIKIVSHNDVGIQDLFKSGSVMVTDYSSVAMDFAYLKKPVLYYQFDEKEVFEGHSHTVQKGYFDYRVDGYGPVVNNESDLLKELKSLLKTDCTMEKIYLERVDRTFCWRDGKCCERVYDVIKNSI